MAQAVEAPYPVAPLVQQPDGAQDGDVLADGGATDVEGRRDLARRELLAGHQPQDRPAVRLPQGLHDIVVEMHRHAENVSDGARVACELVVIRMNLERRGWFLITLFVRIGALCRLLGAPG